MRSARGKFDNLSYWIAFVLIISFVTYFLTSMIKLANKEDAKYSTAVLEGYEEQNSMIKERRAQNIRVDEFGDIVGVGE